MSFSKLTWLKRTDGHKFTGAEFRVLIALFNHSGADGTDSHPGIKLLADETGYRKAAISQALTALQERGWITQTRKGSGISGHTSVFALIPDAPRPPGGSATADQPDAGGRSTGADQPTEVGPLERTSWSTGVDVVGPLEWTPTDPDTRSGSDLAGSDPGEVRYPPNHLAQNETGPESRSLATAGTQATGTDQPAKLRQAEPATGSFDDPFADRPTPRMERDVDGVLRPVLAGGPTASPWE